VAEIVRIGICGGGKPGWSHCNGSRLAGGFKIVAIADPIASRRQKLASEFAIPQQFPTAEALIDEPTIDAVSICLPNHLHAPIAIAALRAGKHVICESPPALNAAQTRRMTAAALKSGKVLLYAMQRRLGGSEQAAHQAIEKGYAGEVYHVRASWTRTRGIPVGTGWFSDRDKSGGGATIDLGTPMLDLAWHLLGEPKAESVFAVMHGRLAAAGRAGPAPADRHKPAESNGGENIFPAGPGGSVEEAAFVLLRFAGGKTIELTAAWAINQPPQQNGTICRVHGEKAAIDVYTPQGAVLYRDFQRADGPKPTILKPPNLVQQAALMRHFRKCITSGAVPQPGPAQGQNLMEMIDAIYRSAASGRSVAM
jgi:predicted dehydrogenase